MATTELISGSIGKLLEPGLAILDHQDRPKPVIIANGSLVPDEKLMGKSVPVTVQVTSFSGSQSAIPTQVYFGALRDPELRLKRPIPLETSREEGAVVVSWSETFEYSTGDSLSAAMDDFSRGLSELYRELFAPDAKLSADLQRVRDCLGKYIEKRK